MLGGLLRYQHTLSAAQLRGNTTYLRRLRDVRPKEFFDATARVLAGEDSGEGPSVESRRRMYKAQMLCQQRIPLPGHLAQGRTRQSTPWLNVRLASHHLQLTAATLSCACCTSGTDQTPSPSPQSEQQVGEGRQAGGGQGGWVELACIERGCTCTCTMHVPAACDPSAAVLGAPAGVTRVRRSWRGCVDQRGSRRRASFRSCAPLRCRSRCAPGGGGKKSAAAFTSIHAAKLRVADTWPGKLGAPALPPAPALCTLPAHVHVPPSLPAHPPVRTCPRSSCARCRCWAPRCLWCSPRRAWRRRLWERGSNFETWRHGW